MRFPIVFVALLASASAATLRANPRGDSLRHVVDRPLSLLTAEIKVESSEGIHNDIVGISSASSSRSGKERDNALNFFDFFQKVDRRTAVGIGAFSGALLGAVTGATGVLTAPDAVRCAAVGGFAGGIVGLLWDLPYERELARRKEEAQLRKKEAAELAEKRLRGNVTELPEPALEKLHQLALTAVALSDYEESRAKKKGNKTEERIERAAEKKAVSALDDIAARINSTEKEPMVESDGDFDDIQEVLSEGDTAEFVSAESANANNALVTANDVARVQAGKNHSRLRGEDIGPAGDMQSFQGDMIPGNPTQFMLFQTVAEHMTASNQTGPENSVAAGATWTGGRVKFCFASDVSANVRHIFLAAANQYHVAVPCLEFVDVGWASGSSSSHESQQKCNESPAIFVQSNAAEGCYSYVGMVGWKQSQRLQMQDPGCVNIGTSVHELGHAIGMAHEQSRPDRDNYVRINWGNIQDGMEHNFEVEEKAHTGLDYDFLSVMHYDTFSFAKDPSRPTIETRDSDGHSGSLGQRSGLSAYDVEQVADMYRRAEGQDCNGNALAGMGCINKPNDNGEDLCDITKCNSKALNHCCACGGGIQVQCYEGQACPRTELLPMDMEASDCIEDATHLFAGQGHECIYTNVCKFNVEFKCPGLGCSHKVRSKNYEAAQCNNQYQTKICTAKSECQVFKM